MSRVLIAVGCDNYLHLHPLNGAERDATGIFSILTHPEYGEYDVSSSRILLSPSLGELREALNKALYDIKEIDTLTFFFAGHGVVKTGSYWLCLSDTAYDKLSATGFNIAELFTRLNEIQPRHSNIILDACQAGGIVSDLNAILKPELIGARNSPGISILASAATDEKAGESAQGGFATNLLLKAINGDLSVQVERPTLDLSEIGGVISKEMQSVNPNQMPTFWGLNLLGASHFCKNQNYRGERLESMPHLPTLRVGSASADVVRGFSDRIWKQYFSLDENFSAESLIDLISKVVCSLSDNEGVEFVRGINSTFRARSTFSAEPFRAAEVVACLICAVSRSKMQTENERQIILELAVLLIDEINQAIRETGDLIEGNRFRLAYGGPAALYYFPLRVAKLLGWCGAAYQICAALGRGELLDSHSSLRLISQLINQYAGGLVAMSDLQAPFLLIFLKSCLDQNQSEWAELVAGSTFHSFVEVQGRLAAPSITPSEVFEYILRRSERRLNDAHDLTAHPSEVLSVLLKASEMFGLEKVIDPYLYSLDHVSFNLFIPHDYSEFSDLHIEDGINHTFKIGHGIWRCADFYAQWRTTCNTQVVSAPTFSSASVKIAAVVSSLLQPNRTPWIICGVAVSDGVK